MKKINSDEVLIIAEYGNDQYRSVSLKKVLEILSEVALDELYEEMVESDRVFDLKEVHWTMIEQNIELELTQDTTEGYFTFL